MASGSVSRRSVLATGVASLAAPAVSRAVAPRPLQFWQFYAPGGHVAAEAGWFEDLVRTWNRDHTPPVELRYVPNDQYMNGAKLQISFASGEGPDVFLISAGDFLRYANADILLDLDPFVAPEIRRDFPPSVLAPRVVGNRLLAIPMEVEPLAFYYSVDAFEAAGLSEHDIPTSWQALLEVARRLTTDRRYGLLFDTTPGYYQNFTWYPFLWQGGGDIVGANNRSRLAEPAAVQALGFWRDSVRLGVAPRKTLGGGAFDIVPNLASGYCAIQQCGSWGISELRSNAPGFRYGVFRLAVPPSGRYTTVGGGWAFCANARARQPEAAGRFCAWALASADPASIRRVTDWCTVAKSDMPPRESGFAVAAKAYDTGFLKQFRDEIFPGTRAEPRVPPPVYKAISDAIQACQLGGDDPQRQAHLLAGQVDNFLSTYAGASII